MSSDVNAVRLCVATPTRDSRVHVAHSECVRVMEIRSRDSGIPFCRAHVAGYRIDAMRDDLARVALDWGATHVLYLDDDVALPQANALDILLSALFSTGAELAAAACLSKPPEIDERGRPSREPPLASCLEDAEGRRVVPDVRGHALHMPPEGMRWLLGAGALLVDVRAFARFDRPWFRFADGLSEDWWFSREIQRRGGRAVLVPSVESTHYGVTGWCWRGAA